MEKVGIFGGTFNPVHSEHVEICVKAIKELNLDRLIVMPTFSSPHKTLIPASSQDRLEMLKLAFNGVDKIEISDYEINKGGKSYTYQTLTYLKEEYPNAELYFIVGGDMLKDFKTWKNPKIILDKATLCVIDRQDEFTDFEKEAEYFTKTFNKEFIKLKYIGKKFSSSEIRINSALNLPIDDICIKSVAKYIEDKGLYLGGKYEKFVLENVKQSRIVHIAGVIKAALKKAKELSLDQNKVYISALLHDCAKYLDYNDYKDFVLPENMPNPVIHAYLGGYVAQNVLGIDDMEIIDAIRYHTSGRANMTTLEKLIFVADMIEDGRTYQGVDELRQLYYKEDFEKCFVTSLKEEFLHLLNKKQYIFYKTVEAYDYYVKD